MLNYLLSLIYICVQNFIKFPHHFYENITCAALIWKCKYWQPGLYKEESTMKTRLAYLIFLILASVFLGSIVGMNVAG